MRDRLQALGMKWLRAAWENPLLLLLVFLMGGTSSFVYSYVPLQGTRDWEIDYLERRVDAQNQQMQALEMEVSKHRADMASRPEAAVFDKLVDDRDSAEKRATEFEKKAKSAEATVKSLRKTRDQWKKKYNELLAKRDATPPPPPVPVSEPEPEPEPIPASPAPAPTPADPNVAEWDAPTP